MSRVCASSLNDSLIDCVLFQSRMRRLTTTRWLTPIQTLCNPSSLRHCDNKLARCVLVRGYLVAVDIFIKAVVTEWVTVVAIGLQDACICVELGGVIAREDLWCQNVSNHCRQNRSPELSCKVNSPHFLSHSQYRSFCLSRVQGRRTEVLRKLARVSRLRQPVQRIYPHCFACIALPTAH